MIFSEAFLLKRPLLQAITEHERAPVLLIDEIDRSDEEFEAFLLEVLSDFQVTIPEIGPIKATHRPHVVLTSNRSRDLSDALRRRCLYHWIDYPSLEKELEIVRAKVPAIKAGLAVRVTEVMQATRTMSLSKIPGVAETLDWAKALVALQAEELNEAIVAETLGCFLKDEGDVAAFKAELPGIIRG
jgi:MoxR-like ATPase